MNLRRFARFSLALSSLALVPLAGCRQVLDIEDPVECGSDDACTQADSPCIAGECVDGYCAYSFRAEGTVIDEAAEDDCLGKSMLVSTSSASAARHGVPSSIARSSRMRSICKALCRSSSATRASRKMPASDLAE
jgi:hypothetical protein